MRELPLFGLDQRACESYHGERRYQGRYVEEDVRRVGVHNLERNQRENRLHRERRPDSDKGWTKALERRRPDSDEGWTEARRNAVNDEAPGKERQPEHIRRNRGNRRERVLSFHELGNHYEREYEGRVDPVEDVNINGEPQHKRAS